MFKGLWFFIRFSWKHDKRYIIYQILNQFITSMIPIVAVVMPRYIIDELMGQGRAAYLLLWAGILIGYTCAAGALSSWLTWSAFTRRIKLAQDFSVQMHRRTLNADYADIESSRYLELKERAEKFLFGNWMGFASVLDLGISIIGRAFTLMGVAAVIASLHPLLVLLFVGLVLGSSYIEARVRRQQAALRMSIVPAERRCAYYNNIMQDFNYGKETRINCMGPWLMRREHEHWQYMSRIYRKSNRLGIRTGFVNALTGLVQQAAAYAYLLHQALVGQITVGDFSMYAGGVAAFSGAMRSLMETVIELSAFRPYYDAVDEFLAIPSRMRENARLPLPDGPHEIEFRGVSFAYPGQEGFALRDINITLGPGESLSVVGENGAGKTTFVKLLCRIYDPTQGCILCDGVDIRDIDYDAYMGLFSTVFQDFKLYELPLRDNVALSMADEADDTRVIKALRLAGFGDRLDTLPKGLDTPVYRTFEGEGFEPSGGEGQKIALARALFKDAPIVVLDEPTAALDPRAEREMYRNFHRLTTGKTAVYISHRLASTRLCERIAVFASGRIVELGRHEALMALGGIYAELMGAGMQE